MKLNCHSIISLLSAICVVFGTLSGAAASGSSSSSSSSTLDKFDIPASWQNIAIVRTLDVSKAYVKEALNINIKNIDSHPVSEYIHPLPKLLTDDYALILATTEGPRGQYVIPTKIFKNIDNESLPYNFLMLKFPTPAAPDAVINIQLQFVILRQLKPVPDQIGLNDAQSLLLKTFKYPVSAYHTKEYKLEVTGTDDGQVQNLQSSDKEADTVLLPSLKPVQITKSKGSGLSAVFEADGEIEPFTLVYASFLFLRNKPLAVAENLTRDVWISHWGNSLSFEETYEVTNKVGKLKNGFSRLNWMTSPYQMQVGPHIVALDMELPQNFKESYFIDLVGNVSTSKILKNHLILKPRYPIFGGWNYNFTIGWTHDLQDFVKQLQLTTPGQNAKETFLVKVPLLNGHQDISYNNVKVSFYLPEGAEFLEVASPIPYENYEISLVKSYLDFSGHTKVTIIYKNLVDEFRQSDVIVKYKYTVKDYYRKPLIISTYLFIALTGYLLLSWINVSIDPAAAAAAAAAAASDNGRYQKIADGDEIKEEEEQEKKKAAA